MGTPQAIAAPHTTSRVWIRLALALFALGLLGHVLAAHTMGGSTIAYTHHVAGFFIILVVTGAPVALLGWRFWRAHADRTLLIIGLIQAVLGAMVFLAEWRRFH